MAVTAAAQSGPFFLHVAHDQRFCFFHAPVLAPGQATRGAVLAVHAFAEEMNKTRAAVAEGARALAREGYGVLQIDLAGCGDSTGDFGDATWSAWITDLEAAWAWLDDRCAGPRWLWGTRFGALLATQFAARARPAVDGLLLWQPVVNGAQHLGQFLRLKTVNSMLRGQGNDAGAARPEAASIVAPSPRVDLASGLAVEVAGYQLTPLLADAMEAAKLSPQDAPPPRVCWFEVSSQPDATPAPISQRVAAGWSAAGSDVTLAVVEGQAFWQTLEIERCPSLVDATVAALRV